MVEAGSTMPTQRFSPRPNFPAEDKSHNLRVDVVDPILPVMLQGMDMDIISSSHFGEYGTQAIELHCHVLPGDPYRSSVFINYIKFCL